MHVTSLAAGVPTSNVDTVICHLNTSYIVLRGSRGQADMEVRVSKPTQLCVYTAKNIKRFEVAGGVP